jgi:ABC-type transporter Mla subunit MlaD
MEGTMSEQPGSHPAFRQWAEQRLQEIETTLASLEAGAGRLKDELKAEADHAIAALKQQRDALRATLNEVETEAASAFAIRRAQIEEAFQQVKEVAVAADARMDKLAEAGRHSLAALSDALQESRKAFDHAAQKAWDALKTATSGKS